MVIFSITDTIPFSIGLSILAVALWSTALGIVIRGPTRRRSELPLYLVAVIVSVGTLGSAWGSAMANGVAPFVLDRQVIVVVAGMGRGALVVGAILVLALHRARRSRG